MKYRSQDGKINFHKKEKFFSRPRPDHQDNDHAEANLHNCTNCGNIFRAKDHFPKHVENLHCVDLVLPVSYVASPRGATAKLANTFIMFITCPSSLWRLMSFYRVFFFWPPLNLTKSQAMYNLNWPPLKFSKYKNL